MDRRAGIDARHLRCRPENVVDVHRRRGLESRIGAQWWSVFCSMEDHEERREGARAECQHLCVLSKNQRTQSDLLT